MNCIPIFLSIFYLSLSLSLSLSLFLVLFLWNSSFFVLFCSYLIHDFVCFVVVIEQLHRGRVLVRCPGAKPGKYVEMYTVSRTAKLIFYEKHGGNWAPFPLLH